MATLSGSISMPVKVAPEGNAEPIKIEEYPQKQPSSSTRPPSGCAATMAVNIGPDEVECPLVNGRHRGSYGGGTFVEIRGLH